MSNKETLDRKYKDIRADYAAAYKKGLRHAVIVKDLAWKYYMAETTIANIVWEQGGYGKPKTENEQQLNMGL